MKKLIFLSIMLMVTSIIALSFKTEPAKKKNNTATVVKDSIGSVRAFMSVYKVLMSPRCMNCHTAAAHNECTLKPPAGVVLSDNCIDCHMPLLPSNKIVLEIAGRQSSEPDFVRTHRIAVYRESTKQFLQKKKN